MADLAERDIAEKVFAIVCFGRPTNTTGMRAADYYQVTIDPNTLSPSGEYIRFGLYQGDEITGWQRVEAMTVVEMLGPSDAKLLISESGYSHDPEAVARMWTVEE